MTLKDAGWRVVDPDLRANSTTVLRIVDGSVILLNPSGHPQFAIYRFAERASLMIAEYS